MDRHVPKIDAGREWPDGEVGQQCFYHLPLYLPRAQGQAKGKVALFDDGVDQEVPAVEDRREEQLVEHYRPQHSGYFGPVLEEAQRYLGQYLTVPEMQSGPVIQHSDHPKINRPFLVPFLTSISFA